MTQHLSNLILLSFLLLGSFMFPSQAIAPVTVCNWQYQFATQNYLFLPASQCLYMTNKTGYLNYVSFTCVSFSSTQNPCLTFGVGNQGGNTTLSQINGAGSEAVVLNGTANTNQILNVSFYFPSSQSTPLQVQVNSLPAMAQAQFFTSYSSWFTTSGNNVYWNQTGNYVEVKTSYSNPTLSFEIESSGNPGGGCQGSCQKQNQTQIIFSGSSVILNNVTISMSPGQERQLSINASDRGSQALEIISALMTSPQGVSIQPVSKFPWTVQPNTTASFTVLASVSSSTRPGSYSSNATIYYINGILDTAATFMITINVLGPPGSHGANPFGFLSTFITSIFTNVLLDALIVTVAVVLGGMMLIRKRNGSNYLILVFLIG